MAHYTPDHKYAAGKKALEELQGKTGDLIRYYVAQKEKFYKKQEEYIAEMKTVFDGIRKFTMGY